MPVATNPSFFPTRLSQYVPAMRYASDVNMHGGISRISFGAALLADADGILDGQTIAVAITIEAASLLSYQADTPWGRNITAVADSTATSTVTINGYDYLGQPMTEVITLNSGTPVVGVKCFKRIRNIVLGATASRTVDIGWGSVLGLPYKAIKVLTEESDGAPATLGTLTAPVLTSPATSTTGEPRGKYTPNTTPDGAKIITATFVFDNTVNSSNVGGLHGVPHYSA